MFTIDKNILLEPPEEDGFFTYILLCEDGSFYTGWTTNLKKRLQAHKDGKGAKYTRMHPPIGLVWYASFETRREAMQNEAAIKKMSRKQKEEIIQQFFQR